MNYKIALLVLLSFTGFSVAGQGHLPGIVSSEGKAVAGALLRLEGTEQEVRSDSSGHFELSAAAGRYMLHVRATGFELFAEPVDIGQDPNKPLTVRLSRAAGGLNEIVVTGTMKATSRSESPVPVEVYTPKFFRQNPTPSLFEAIGMINGVQPQLNCNVCNTGDIHINGMEGPYTMILIDGMPIVSSLSTVYGLSGIPNSLVERIEVVKGPGSSLYGSEAMGGIINVITKNPLRAPKLGADVFMTSWGELSADVSFKLHAGKMTSLTGINYFNYQHPADNNHDGFTDMTLQNRISIFNKWTLQRKDNRVASLGARYVYEDRWGGQMDWTPKWRGSDSIYGESIYTRRVELIGMYQLPLKEQIFFQASYNWHNQDSYYGIVPFMATQQVFFAQLYWQHKLNAAHDLLLGSGFRYTYYDDNTPGTLSADGLHNMPAKTPLPGIFIQDEWKPERHHTILAGYRYDYDRYHGSVHSPRLAYKFSPNDNNTLRASFGTGFRVVNLFTEDHSALTGAREVVIANALRPERSLNGNLNYVRKIPARRYFLNLDATAFYSYFTNKIVGDFDTDPNKIIYDNLSGYAVSRGLALNTDLVCSIPLKVSVGITYMDVFLMQRRAAGTMQRTQQLHAPNWSGTFTVNYQFPRQRLSIDLTGQWKGPMRLPILPNDYRPEYSPWFCIANIQVTRKFRNGIELYGGAKNLLNFVPTYALMRPFDPFDKHVQDPVNNPQGYTFDTEYNYTSLQGIRAFLGFRYNLF